MIKLDWYAKKMPGRVEWVKDIFMEKVYIRHIILCSLAYLHILAFLASFKIIKLILQLCLSSQYLK